VLGRKMDGLNASVLSASACDSCVAVSDVAEGDRSPVFNVNTRTIAESSTEITNLKSSAEILFQTAKDVEMSDDVAATEESLFGKAKEFEEHLRTAATLVSQLAGAVNGSDPSYSNGMAAAAASLTKSADELQKIQLRPQDDAVACDDDEADDEDDVANASFVLVGAAEANQAARSPTPADADEADQLRRTGAAQSLLSAMQNAKDGHSHLQTAQRIADGILDLKRVQAELKAAVSALADGVTELHLKQRRMRLLSEITDVKDRLKDLRQQARSMTRPTMPDAQEVLKSLSTELIRLTGLAVPVVLSDGAREMALLWLESRSKFKHEAVWYLQKQSVEQMEEKASLLVVEAHALNAKGENASEKVADLKRQTAEEFNNRAQNTLDNLALAQEKLQDARLDSVMKDSVFDKPEAAADPQDGAASPPEASPQVLDAALDLEREPAQADGSDLDEEDADKQLVEDLGGQGEKNRGARRKAAWNAAGAGLASARDGFYKGGAAVGKFSVDAANAPVRLGSYMQQKASDRMALWQENSALSTKKSEVLNAKILPLLKKVEDALRNISPPQAGSREDPAKMTDLRKAEQRFGRAVRYASDITNITLTAVVKIAGTRGDRWRRHWTKTVPAAPDAGEGGSIKHFLKNGSLVPFSNKSANSVLREHGEDSPGLAAKTGAWAAKIIGTTAAAAGVVAATVWGGSKIADAFRGGSSSYGSSHSNNDGDGSGSGDNRSGGSGDNNGDRDRNTSGGNNYYPGNDNDFWPNSNNNGTPNYFNPRNNSSNQNSTTYIIVGVSVGVTIVIALLIVFYCNCCGGKKKNEDIMAMRKKKDFLRGYHGDMEPYHNPRDYLGDYDADKLLMIDDDWGVDYRTTTYGGGSHGNSRKIRGNKNSNLNRGNGNGKKQCKTQPSRETQVWEQTAYGMVI